MRHKQRPFNASQPAQVTPKVVAPSESWWLCKPEEFRQKHRREQARMNGVLDLDYIKKAHQVRGNTDGA